MTETNINVISEGQPVTYELINQIINTVNSIKQTSDEVSQIIEVYGGQRLGRSEDRKIIIQAGDFPLDFGEGNSPKAARATANVTFPTESIFNTRPYVTLAVEDVSSSSQGGKNSFITTTITDLTTKGFTVRSRRLTSNANVEKDRVRVHYIAIGTAAR